AGVKVETVTGADTRASSVAAGLRYILALIESAELAANTRVLVHDAARPLVRRRTIERLVTEVDKVHACGGLLATPATDTLKVANADVTVAQTLDRSLIWQAQTPQLFDVRVLHDAIQSAMDNGMPVTDEASAMEFAGYTPLLVEGDKDNIKLTHSLDLSLAEILLQAQETE
ncbi:MAG: 2-C-methyl-D-erythritol 4-phosphate cytidylyltransferase, partial [Granulosicoccus sp.]|nr:2-C-methyl-D-erythritol 4-phosphate cytidylyltransferase [Granulosicoccus sp.]